VSRGAHPVFAGFETVNAVHTAIVGQGAPGRSQRQPRAIGEDGDSCPADAILVKHAPGEGALVTQPELSKQIGLGSDQDGRSAADGEPLAVGGREISIAHGNQKVDARGNGGKHELATSARSRGERRGFADTGHGVEPDNRSRQRTAGSLLQHDSLDGPSPDTDGDRQQNEDAMHRSALHCYDGWSRPGVEPM
jgi:hypothetical protein